MSLAVGVQSVLEGVKTELETRIATALTDIDGAGGPTLTAPAAADVLVWSSFDEPMKAHKRPEVRISWEGTDDGDQVLTATDIVYGEVVCRLACNGVSPVLADQAARYYGLALRHSLNRIGGQNVTGLIACRVQGEPVFEAIGRTDILGRIVETRARAIIVTEGAR